MPLSDNEEHNILMGIAFLQRGQKDHSLQLHKMEQRLFGNGQPGAIQKMEETVKEIENRISTLEKFKYTLAGMGLGIGFVGGILGAILDKLWRGIRF